MRTAMTLILIIFSSYAASEEYVLEHNPFKRPLLNIGPSSTDGAPVISDELVLKATLAAGSGALANINGQLFRLGDEVNGFRVMEINEGSVDLVRNDQVRRLTVRDEYSE